MDAFTKNAYFAIPLDIMLALLSGDHFSSRFIVSDIIGPYTASLLT